MPTIFEGRSSYRDLIDDIVESPSSSYPIKILQNRSYSSGPLSVHKKENLKITRTNELYDRHHLPLPRSNSSLIMMNNDERRKEIDLIIKQLYDGKLITSINDDQSPLDDVEPSTTIATIKTDKENNIDFFPLDCDQTSLQRELQEKELDIVHLRKEIQELQIENKLLKSKVPTNYSNSYTSNNPEIEAIRREKDILQNELHTLQELIAKIQQQQPQNVLINRSNKIDDVTLQQKEALEKKLKTYEKQMYLLSNENEKYKQNFHQTERIIVQLRRENEELQQKLIEARKRNDELFYQEFNVLRNDLKVLKQRNNELFENNLRLQQKPNSKYLRIERSISPNISEASDSTNYLASVSVEQYNNRPSTSVHRSTTLNGNNHHRIARHNSSIGQTKTKSIDQQFSTRSSKIKRSIPWNDENIQTNEESLKYALVPYIGTNGYQIKESQYHSRRMITNGTNNHQDDRRPIRKNIEINNSRRPYAPSSINDVHLNDVVKFSRPGGKISKGVVKYIGLLPDKNDQYLGLELEDEESKHDGIYQDKRLFQCKPNKGVFVAFNKVIMAWSET